MARRRLGWAMALCAAVLRPPLMALTKRDWRGTENVPATQGCVFVTNHVSEFDFMTYAHFIYDNGRIPRFLAKSEIFAVPVVGAIVRSAGQIPVYRKGSRGGQAFDAAVTAVADGQAVIVYPEGSLTRDPDLWPMRGKTGAARIALSTGCPVIPTAQWGPQEVLAPYARRPRLFPRKTMQVRVGPPVDLSAYADKPLTPEVLREATDTIMAAITALLADIRQETAPPVRFDPRSAGIPETGNLRRPRRPGSGDDPHEGGTA